MRNTSSTALLSLAVFAAACSGGSAPSPTVTKPSITAFTASPATVPAGGSLTLSWTVTGQLDSLVVTPGNLNVLADTNTSTGSGSHLITAASPPVTYTLTATNAGGSDTRMAPVALSAGPKRLLYTDPTSTSAKLLLVRNAASTDGHLILDMKVGATPVTAFGVALNIPFDVSSAGMIAVPGTNAILAGLINFGSSPPTAASVLGGSSSAMTNLFSVGVARKKTSVTDGDDTWAAGSILFSIAFDMTAAAVGGTNVFNAASLAGNARFRAAALKKDGTEGVSKSDIALGDLIVSN